VSHLASPGVPLDVLEPKVAPNPKIAQNGECASQLPHPLSYNIQLVLYIIHYFERFQLTARFQRNFLLKQEIVVDRGVRHIRVLRPLKRFSVY